MIKINEMKKSYFYLILIVSIVANIGLICICSFLYMRFYTYELHTKYSSRSYEDRKIAMIGNSITENWNSLHQDFFDQRKIANLGIGGNTSEDIMLRFRKDVIESSYNTVILNIGINDICQSNYSSEITINNLLNIIELCKLHDIDLVLSSVLPANEKFKVSAITTFNISPEKIKTLNSKISQLATEHNLIFIDFDKQLQREEYISKYTYDGIHPNYEGYLLLESIIQPYLETIRANQ